jgi:hypothetical protein
MCLDEEVRKLTYVQPGGNRGAARQVVATGERFIAEATKKEHVPPPPPTHQSGNATTHDQGTTLLACYLETKLI